MAKGKALDKKQQNMIAAGILAVGVIFAFYKYVYTPTNKKIKKIKDDIVKKEEKLTATQQKAMRLDRLEAEFESLKRELSKVEKKLPKETRIPELIQLVSKIGRKYGINISNFNPRGPEKKQYYLTYPFEMNILTTYHTLGLFLTDLLQQERILGIRNLGITVQSSKEDEVPGIGARFVLCAYKYSE